MKSAHLTRFSQSLSGGVLVLMATASGASAAGFYLQEQSTRAVGRAFSGEAADVGPESLWWNPASIGGATERGGYLSATAILPSSTVSDTGSLIVRPGQAPASVGGLPVAHNPLSSGLLPSGGGVLPLSDRVAIGLALSAPFDFTTQYSSQSWARYAALRTRLRTADLQPSIGIAATNWLRLGAGLNIEYSDATLTTALPNLAAALPDGSEVLKGNGWNTGWSVGAQLHDERVTVGVSYKSSIKHTLSTPLTLSGLLGPLAAQNGVVSTHTSFSTPWQVIVGVRVHATDQLTLNLQGARVGWHEFDAIRVLAPVNAALPQDYKNTWSIAGGADYALTPRWTVRGGIQFDQTPTRDGFRDPRVPDADRLNFALGSSFVATSRVTIDAAATYLKFDGASIDRPTAAYVGTPAETDVLMSGRQSDAHAFILSLGAHFKL
jgi:long-chain fatty acid transport protein